MNYSFFLFTQLYNALIGVQYEYDLLFEDLTLLYEVYDSSPYNTPELGEYECMVNFFKAHESTIRADISNRRDMPLLNSNN